MGQALTVNNPQGTVSQLDSAGNAVFSGDITLGTSSYVNIPAPGTITLYSPDGSTINMVNNSGTVTTIASSGGSDTFSSITVTGSSTLQGGANVTGATVSTNFAAQPTASGNTALSINVNSSSFDEFRITGAGTISIGSGTLARDVTISRLGAASLGLDSQLTISTAGKGLTLTEGSNAKMGTATLNGVTAVTVANTSVTANSRIFLTVQTPAGTVGGAAYVSAITAGTSFQIKGILAGDTSTVAYLIVEHA